MGLITFLTYEVVKPKGFPWELLLLNGMDFISNYGLRILLFAVFLKLLLSPLDIYSRYKMRKNARITAALKDRLADLKRQYANDKATYAQKEMQMKRAEGFGMFGSCIPILVTLVLSIWIYGSVRTMASYNNMRQYIEFYNVYQNEYTISKEAGNDDSKSTRIAQQAVYDFYQNNHDHDSFLWIKNVWSSDVPWNPAIPDNLNTVGVYGNADHILKDGKEVSTQTLSAIKGDYATVTALIRESSYNKNNGLLIIILASSGIMMVSQILISRAQRGSGMQLAPTSDSPFAQSMQTNMKLMVYITPAIMALFMLWQPAAFALYMGVGSATTLLISQTSIQIMKHFEKKHEKELITTVQKYGRPDPSSIKVSDVEFDKSELGEIKDIKPDKEKKKNKKDSTEDNE